MRQWVALPANPLQRTEIHQVAVAVLLLELTRLAGKATSHIGVVESQAVISLAATHNSADASLAYWASLLAA